VRALVLVLALLAPAAVAAEPVAIGIAPSAYALPTGRWGFAPEVLAHTYVHVARAWYLRPGGRLGARGLVQEDMSSDLRLEERDLGVVGELGVVRAGRIVPSATLLAGVDRRWISLDATGLDVSMSRADATEWLPVIGGQIGVGLALHRRVMIEPFVRYEVLITDGRTHLRWGFEATMSFGR
jgi:hypothetical protein